MTVIVGHFRMGLRLRQAVRRNASIAAELDRMLREARGAVASVHLGPGIRSLAR